MVAPKNSSSVVSSTVLNIVGAVVTVGCVSLYAWYRGQQQGRDAAPDGAANANKGEEVLPQKQQERATDPVTHATIEMPLESSIEMDQANGDAILEKLFNEASSVAKNLPRLTNTEKLLLYGLYKQATQGDNSNKPPSIFNTVERAKHTAWMKAKGMAKTEAMIHYMQLVKRLRSGVAIVDDDDDMDIGPENSMGLKPSTMAHNEHDDEPEEIEDGTLAVTLRKAARDLDAQALREAIQQGAPVDASDETGQTALHFCADRGWREGVEILLEANAPIGAQDDDGISVLHTAVVADQTETVKLLLQKGADPDQADEDGETPRSSAMEGACKDIKSLFQNMGHETVAYA